MGPTRLRVIRPAALRMIGERTFKALMKIDLNKYIWLSAKTPISTTGHRIVITLPWRSFHFPFSVDDGDVVSRLLCHLGIQPEY